MGDSTYFVPGAGEAADLAYAPIQAMAGGGVSKGWATGDE